MNPPLRQIYFGATCDEKGWDGRQATRTSDKCRALFCRPWWWRLSSVCSCQERMVMATREPPWRSGTNREWEKHCVYGITPPPPSPKYTHTHHHHQGRSWAAFLVAASTPAFRQHWFYPHLARPSRATQHNYYASHGKLPQLGSQVSAPAVAVRLPGRCRSAEAGSGAQDRSRAVQRAGSNGGRGCRAGSSGGPCAHFQRGRPAGGRHGALTCISAW